MPGNFGAVAFDPNAFLKGATAAQAFNQVRAQNMAASDFNPLDTSKSQKDLNMAGLYEDANKLADRPAEVQKQTLGLQQQQQTLDAGKQTMDDNQSKQEWAKVGEVTGELLRAREAGQDPAAAFDAMRPFLQQTMGLDPAHADAIAAQLKTNPQFLDTIHEQALGVAGNTVYDKTTGKVIINGTKAGAAARPQVITKTNADGSSSAYQVVTDESGQTHLQPLPVGSDGAPAVPAGADVMTEDQFATKLQSLAPGAVITSAGRTPEENARVHGAVNSNHLTNNAADAAPPKGMSMSEFNALLQGQGYHTIPEMNNHIVSDPALANHIHVDFNGAHPGNAVAAGGSQANYKFGGTPPKAGSEPAINDPEVLAYDADQFSQGKGLPQMGRSKEAVAYYKEVKKKALELHPDLDAGTAAAVYSANSKSLTQNTKQTDVQQGQELAAEAAGNLIKLNGQDLGLTGNGPMIDGPLLEFKIATGDPKVTVYKNFVDSFANEYAKIISGATGAAGSTDAANREAHSRLNAGMVGGQIDAVLNAMTKEMQAKLGAQKSNISDIAGRMKSPAKGDGGAVDLDALWKKHGGQ